MKNSEKFTADEIKTLEPSEKVGLLATVDPEGRPHISLITSIQPVSEDKLAFGEFSRGISKYHIRKNPKCAFLMMTLDKCLWRGTALWTGFREEGPEYEMFNEKPMFRYNSYFGINKVHYLDLVFTAGREKLPMSDIVKSVLLTLLSGKEKSSDEQPLNRLGLSFFNKVSSLKFLSYVNNNGFPEIIPVIQCRAASPATLRFSPAAYRNDLMRIPEGQECAVFAMTLDMESIMTRGRFNGIKRSGPVKAGEIKIDYVYNSMPPVHGQIYPPVHLEPVKEF